MTTHAQGPSDALSAAKITVFGSIATALIAGVAGFAVQAINRDSPTSVAKDSPPSAAAPAPAPAQAQVGQSGFKPPLSQESDDGSWDYLQYHGTDSVSLSGIAKDYVQAVFIAIGPNSSNAYWASHVDVVDQHWQATVPTGQPSKSYPITVKYWPSRDTTPAAPKQRSVPSAVPVTAPVGRSVLGNQPSPHMVTVSLASAQTTPPAPPSNPDQLANCVEKYGPNCLSGPGFGPPSVYKPTQ